ncbi:MAG: MBOAT family O-acyltransferase [Spirosomataceae bacterium]
MLFNSIDFLVFFPIVTIGYFALPQRFRWFWLLAASCYFYMAFLPIYILILGFTVVVDYFAGIWIEQSEGQRRKWFLVASLVANIGVLAIFKYYNFLIDNFNLFLPSDKSLPLLTILLPIGLSFHTFQAMSYTIEVYRGNQKAERNFGIYALYVMFYPQLVAGPIERPQNILHQFYEKHNFDYQRVVDGLKLMAWGMFKKVVIADRLATMVNQVYSHPTDYTGIPLVLATVFFAFQIYCDFSGYSDIALGAAKVMGFTLMKNFDRPYFSKTISEFWRRWHISLSTWFRDYLYIPLGGNRVSTGRWYFNQFFVFLMSGLWHGASWNFVIWGGLHGIYLIIALKTASFRNQLVKSLGLLAWPFVYKTIQCLTVFVLVDIAWIFFRAVTFHDAWHVLTHLHVGIGEQLRQLSNPEFLRTAILLGESRQTFLMLLFFMGVMEAVHYFQRDRSITTWLNQRHWLVRWSIYYVFIMVILLFGAFDQPSQFIYFQF